MEVVLRNCLFSILISWRLDVNGHAVALLERGKQENIRRTHRSYDFIYARSSYRIRW